MRRDSALGFLLCTGLGLWFGCDSLWGGLAKDNPANCVVSLNSCPTDEFCSPDTERCTPNSQSCVQNPGLCMADQSCDANSQRCMSKLVLTQVMPILGPDGGGTRLTITGNYFRPGINVYIDNNQATNLTLQGPTSLSVDLPAHLRHSGPANVKLVQSDGTTVSNLSLFSYYLGSLDLSSYKTLQGVLGDSILTADFNNDGFADVATAQDTTVYVSLGNVFGTWNAPRTSVLREVGWVL